MNAVTNVDTGYSPFYLMFGREPSLAEDNILEHLNKEHEEYDFIHLAIAPIVRARAADTLTDEHEKWKMRWNEAHPGATFKEGEKVMVKEYQTQGEICRKFQPRYSGPYTIVKVNGNNTVVLDGEWKKRTNLVSTSRIFQFKPRQTEPDDQEDDHEEPPEEISTNEHQEQRQSRRVRKAPTRLIETMG